MALEWCVSKKMDVAELLCGCLNTLSSGVTSALVPGDVVSTYPCVSWEEWRTLTFKPGGKEIMRAVILEKIEG